MSLLNRFGGFFSLGKDINKVQGDELNKAEGVISDLLPELTIDTADKDLIKLKKQWIRGWERDQTILHRKQKDSERYWLGRQKDGFFDNDDGAHGLISSQTGHDHAKIDNIIFEALETFLPQATKKNPEPIVTADETPEGKNLADNVRKMLISLSDTLVFKLKLKSVVRNWSLYYLGIVKVGWDFIEDEITMVVLRPQKFIMDPNATITEKGVYTGEYLGEFRQDTATKLIERFPAKKEFITKFVNDQLGTKIQYIEWWANNGRILFWTLKDEVLSKTLNPHWNYDEERTVIDDDGLETTESFTQDNHFKTPQFPYTFLSVFNLGKKPYDETSLIEQNLGNQDLITKRYRQIDRNIDGLNGGWAISGERSGITKEQAASAIRAFREGRGVWIPQGSVRDAVERIQGTGLPNDVFNNLQDGRNQLRNIFGVSGSTAEGSKQEQTVRGKIIVAQQDQSRIGGGVSEYLEQFSDRVFNWFVQLMYVYYDEDHIGSVLGKANARETVTLRNTDLDRQLIVSVKEGSMIPKDPLTQANQAIDLAEAGMIAPITLHERLDDPNPRETVKQLVEFQTNPQGILEEEQPVAQQQAVPGVLPALPTNI